MWNRNTFSEKVERIKAEDKSITYLDIIQEICQRNEIELVVVPDLLTDMLKRRIAKEAHSMRMVKDSAIDSAPNTMFGFSLEGIEDDQGSD